jgi:NADPH:quinone reductase-like Zn-dependent oxidoreductase
MEFGCAGRTVRVGVIAASVNAGEEKVISGDFVGRFLHAKTTPLVLGWDFAGNIDALGDGVTDIVEASPCGATWRTPFSQGKVLTRSTSRCHATR